MLRKIVQINEEKCDGCGLCIGACHEAALQLVNGKAKLVSDNLCDGILPAASPLRTYRPWHVAAPAARRKPLNGLEQPTRTQLCRLFPNCSNGPASCSWYRPVPRILTMPIFWLPPTVRPMPMPICMPTSCVTKSQ